MNLQGGRIAVPGTYAMGAEAYHADPVVAPSLSSTVARALIEQSPRHAFALHPRLNPEYRSEESNRFDFGTIAHAMLLERDESKLVIVDAEDWRTKAAREARDAARASGQIPVLAAKVSSLRNMVLTARQFLATTELADIFNDGEAEVTAVWQEGDIWLRTRNDWLPSHREVILDYKTTETSGAPRQFVRQIANMGYDFQAGFYTRGLAALGTPDAEFVLLVQEVEPPYACSLFAMSSAFKEIAATKVEQAIRLWRHCMKTQEWPAYAPAIHYAEPPAWAVNQHLTEAGEWVR